MEGSRVQLQLRKLYRGTQEDNVAWSRIHIQVIDALFDSRRTYLPHSSSYRIIILRYSARVISYDDAHEIFSMSRTRIICYNIPKNSTRYLSVATRINCIYLLVLLPLFKPESLPVEHRYVHNMVYAYINV